ncbi:MAG: amino acid adenylation domain-containing protein, partial [Chitinispirillia bacterium]
MKNSKNNSEKQGGSIIPPKDREKILNEWNATERKFPLHLCLHQIIESQADKTPDRPALSFDGVLMSYREMSEKANQLAHFLIKHGIENDSLVGVCMERSFEMVIALLASIKSGGAYIPFDPEYPQKRLDFIAEDCKAKIILTQGKFKKKLTGVSAKIVCVDKEDFSEYPCTNVMNTTTPDNLAYVIYTSGSTGNPKGAMNIHRAIVNRLCWMQETYRLTESDTIIQKTPYSFDVSVWEFFWPLMYGARLAIAKPEGHKDTEYLTDFIIREKVSVMHFVPSMLRIFLDGKKIDKIQSLRDVIVSGEALPFDLQETFFEKMDSKLHNLYGPTEAAIDVTFWQCQKNSSLKIVPIGRPIANIQMFILNDNLELLPIGETGELHIGGIGLARGYLNRPDLTSEKFIPNPFSKDAESKLYKTGDLARYLPDGNIEYLGRIDFQVKIRGFRIELGEIESVLSQHSSIKNCTVMAREDTPGDKRLVAYIVNDSNQISVSGLQLFLKDKLPDYMIPAIFVSLPSLPLSHNGKIDRKALPKPEKKRPDLAQQYFPPTTGLEKKLEKLWCRLLMIDRVGTDDSYFDLGGNSIQVIQMVSQFQKEHCIEIPIAKVFQYPTIRSLADFIENSEKADTFFQKADDRATRQRIGRFSDDSLEDGVAIVGMTGRFPGAGNIDQLWENLCNGVESISFFSPEELGPGIDEDLKNDPDYVRARGILDDADKFDAKFFGISPSEAKVMDPQQRVFLELCWAALENAGYDPDKFKGIIGVYAGVGDNHYYPVNLLSHPDLLKMVGKLIVGYGNEKDYIATRVSYQLNLTGPSVSANTGCSTSLLSVDNAFRALIDYECDMALAGGIDIYVPQKSGQLFQVGGTFCRDGHCRPFDHKADGTMFCDGAGVVVLKRLKEALADNDRIYATIRATAKNNDGANKMSFLAPSVEGQAQVIAMAQALANINPESISYIEAHGTGTPVGDPIEIEALTKVFRAKTEKNQFCLIGSIKGNIGHPTIASGVAGLIKAALCLYHEKIPATLHYQKPNPKIDFENSPFKVVNRMTEWPRSSIPRIAGVSSFGFGGTNVHAIVEEAPLEKASDKSKAVNLLLISGKTEQALDRSADAMKDFFSRQKDVNLSDAAYTLQVGRKYFGYRRFVVSNSVEESIEILNTLNPNNSGTKYCDIRDPEVIFMFPGQGSQYVNMGRNLYRDEPLFRQNIDNCCDILNSHLDRDLRELLFPESVDEKTSYESLKNTYYTQPAIFTIEYSLAQLWMSWGITPSACIGHSIGEFVCACLAGVFSLNDALRLIALRGRFMRDLPPGSMLSLRCASDEIVDKLPQNIQLASSNGPSLCVVSGPIQDIKDFQEKMEKEKIICRHLHTSHAFHSAMMDPIVEPYIEEVKKAEFSKPSIPFMSTVTTQWINDDQATDPEYWGKHLRMPVLFSHGIKRLCNDAKDGYTIFLEVGPRTTLTTLTRQQLKDPKKQTAIPSLSDTPTDNSEWTALLGAIGHLWLNGKTINWDSFYRNEKRNRIPLPTYQFERKSYWVDPVPQSIQYQSEIPEDHIQPQQQETNIEIAVQL